MDVTFINAIPFQANIVQYYKGDSKGNYDDENQHLKDVACFASHIKAIRTFLEQDETVEYGLICEDDILFHNNFHSRFRDLLENLPKKAPILSLTYMISGPIDQTFVGKNSEMKNLWRIDKEFTWGAQCYLISREYAVKVLSLFDYPFDILMEKYDENKISSEIILRRSNGYMSASPIVIEDCISSDRAPQDIPFHLKHFCFWDYSNFSNSDPLRLSPLAHKIPRDAWENYPFKKN